MSTKRTTLEIIAPTIEEAIDEGLTKLGLTEDEVEVEILDEGTKGLFGLGSRQARIRLTVAKEAAPAMITTEPVEDETVAGTDILEPEKPDVTDHILEIARETVTDLLDMMKIQAEVNVYYGVPDEGDRDTPIHVDIQGQDLSILIGRKAETLNALQYITRLIMGKELEQSIPLVIDVEGYRRRRERQVRQLARRVAEQVRTTGRSQALEPMVPAERRLVHIELRSDPDLFTKSIGEGNRRKVVIHVKN
jgi:spoIIIJ-associated protein